MDKWREVCDFSPSKFLIGTSYATEIHKRPFPCCASPNHGPPVRRWFTLSPGFRNGCLVTLTACFASYGVGPYTSDIGRTPVSHPLLASPYTPCTLGPEHTGRIWHSKCFIRNGARCRTRIGVNHLGRVAHNFSANLALKQGGTLRTLTTSKRNW